MNVFKTGPRFIRGYLETKRFTSLKKQLEKLRARRLCQPLRDKPCVPFKRVINDQRFHKQHLILKKRGAGLKRPDENDHYSSIVQYMKYL